MYRGVLVATLAVGNELSRMLVKASFNWARNIAGLVTRK